MYHKDSFFNIGIIYLNDTKPLNIYRIGIHPFSHLCTRRVAVVFNYRSPACIIINNLELNV